MNPKDDPNIDRIEVGFAPKSDSSTSLKEISIQSEKVAIVEAESRRDAERILEETKGRLEDQIRKDVKEPIDELLTYMPEWEVTAPCMRFESTTLDT